MNETQFAELLVQQISQTEQLILLLEHERVALEQNDAEKLLSTVENKNQMATKINETSRHIQQFLQEQGHPGQLESLDHFIENHVKEQVDYIQTLSKTLKDNLRQSKLLNDSNGKVIAASQHINDNMKRILSIASESETYNPQGKIQTNAEKHVLTKV